MSDLREYEVTVNGETRTYLFNEADAKSAGGVEVKAAPAKSNKQAVPKNKASNVGPVR